MKPEYTASCVEDANAQEPKHDAGKASRFGFGSKFAEMIQSLNLPSFIRPSALKLWGFSSHKEEKPCDDLEMCYFAKYQVPSTFCKTAKLQVSCAGDLFITERASSTFAPRMYSSKIRYGFLSTENKGTGHIFNPYNASTPTWCDQCGDMVFGVYSTRSFRCKLNRL